jgi:hypothetical protein
MLETHITNFLEVSYGLKGTELVTKIMSLDLNISYNDIMDKIFDMIERGDITEIEMVFPNHTSKSFLVLRGTIINVIRRMR